MSPRFIPKTGQKIKPPFMVCKIVSPIYGFILKVQDYRVPFIPKICGVPLVPKICRHAHCLCLLNMWEDVSLCLLNAELSMCHLTLSLHRVVMLCHLTMCCYNVFLTCLTMSLLCVVTTCRLDLLFDNVVTTCRHDLLFHNVITMCRYYLSSCWVIWQLRYVWLAL